MDCLGRGGVKMGEKCRRGQRIGMFLKRLDDFEGCEAFEDFERRRGRGGRPLAAFVERLVVRVLFRRTCIDKVKDV